MSSLDAQYLSYHAKGINRYFYIKPMPYYILTSPYKKIVYKTSRLDDCSKILQLIK